MEGTKWSVVCVWGGCCWAAWCSVRLGDVPWYFVVFCGGCTFRSARWVSATAEGHCGLSLTQQLEDGWKSEVHVGTIELLLVGGEAGGNQSVWQGEDQYTW